MTNALKEVLCNSLIHIDIGIKRFSGNEELYEKSLRQFLRNPYYAAILAGLKSGDVRGAERASQDLKALSYNLGMVRLAKCCDELCSAIREGKGLPDFAAQADEVSAVYGVMERCMKKAFPEG
ncbi:MAG: hypothetical protein ABFD03_02825 [Clostridiaceae bacterium]